jgi:hypothetical protein
MAGQGRRKSARGNLEEKLGKRSGDAAEGETDL